MPQLLDLNHVRIGLLDKCKDLNIESVLSTCDKTLSFSYPYLEAKKIKHEMYIRTKSDEFVVKEIEEGDSYTNFKAVLNVENLIGKDWDRFTNVQPDTVEATIRLALAGTGWSLKVNGTITKKRLVKKNMCSSWDLLQEIKKIFLIEYHFDTINKVVNVYEKIGSDKGVYIMEGLNLQKIDIQSHSHDYATKLVAYGKGDLKVEVTNTKYSNKQLTAIWKDERYTVEADLREDAQAKLDDMAVPYKAYKADVIDLAKVSDKYSLLEYNLGDTITLISKEYGIKEKQRIVKITEYPYEPEKNSVDIANVILTFENKQKEFQDATDTVSNITEDNYTISDNAIKAAVHNIIVATIDVDNLHAISARFGDLEASVAHIQDLSAVNAIITDLNALKASVGDLTALNAKISNLEAKTAQFDTTLSNFLSAGSTQTLHLTSGNVVIDNAVIKSAMIESIAAGKITSGAIDTNNVQIKSTNGHMLIDGTTIQISDVNRVRVQIGEDKQHDYNIYIWDRQGNLMFDGINGLYDYGVKQKVIRNDMVKDDANISASKLDVASLFTVINNDGTHTLNSSKVHLDDKNQTLDVAFNSLTTKVDNIQVGGRNLIRGTKEFLVNKGADKGFSYGGYAHLTQGTDNGFGTITLSATGENGEHWSNVNSNPLTNAVSKDEELTVSFFYKVEDVAKWDNHLLASFETWVGANRTPVDMIAENPISNTWIKFVKTFKVPNLDGITEMRLSLYLAKNGTVSYKKVKLEKGNNATDYTEAPEDIDDSMHSLTTSLNAEQGRIDQLIKDTSISHLDGTTTLLKDAYNQTVSTVNSITSTIASHTTAINKATGDITAVETKANTLEKDLTSVTSRVSSSETHITGLGTRVSSAESTITQHTTQIALKASQSSVDGLTTRMASAESKITPTAIINTVSGTYATKTEVTQTENAWTAKFNSGVGGNIISNSSPNGASGTHFWAVNQASGNTNTLSISDGTELPGITGGLRWNAHRGNNSYSGIMNESFTNIKFDTGSKYQLAISIFCNQTRNVTIEISDQSSSNIVTQLNYSLHNGWQNIIHEFTPNNVGSIPKLIIMDGGTGDCFFMIHYVTLIKGDKAINAYLPNINELHDGNTSISRDGIVVTNGALTIKNHSGVDVFKADANGNLDLNIFDSHFKIAATGHRSTEMWNDVKDLFHLQFDCTNDGSGINIYGIDRNDNNKKTNLLEYHPLNSVTKQDGYLWIGVETRCGYMRIDELYVVNNLSVNHINGKEFVNSSSLAYKDEVEDTVSLEMVDIVKENAIKHYKYIDSIKRDKKTGLILEHLTEEARLLLNPSQTDGIDIYAMVSVLWETVRYQQNLIEEMSKRIA